MISLAAIELLVATVETGSFSRAARRLGVTPSAVSRRVMRLERELGVALLARTTRSLRLTEDGQAFYARCVRIVEEIGDWMGRFSEAIYDTRPWRIFGEGLTAVGAGMFGERNQKPFTAQDVRFTIARA